MAEVSIWTKGSETSVEGNTSILRKVCSVLQRRWSQGRNCKALDAAGPGCEQEQVATVIQDLIKILEAGGLEADKWASMFGRMGGHTLLLSVLESPGDDNEGELAARAVDLCMELCDRFPMKGSSITADEETSLRVSVPIHSTLAKADLVTMHMRRRTQDGAMDTDSRPAREIRRVSFVCSNMLWAGSLVLARYVQACPHLLFNPWEHWPADDDCLCSSKCTKDEMTCVKPLRRLTILEIGAGLGAGGLGAALVAKQLGAEAHLIITDYDAAAVDIIRWSIRASGLRSKEEQGEDGVTCSAQVLDWDRVNEHIQEDGIPKCDVILGAEIIHEPPHAAGVYGAIRSLLAPDGIAIVFNGAPKHRFGAQEWEDMLSADPELEHVTRDVPAALQHGLEALEEQGSATLRLKFHAVRWSKVRDE